jgi:ribosomal-protein-alanine N-acetyltransferase
MHRSPQTCAVQVRQAGPGDASALATLHAACFSQGWDVGAIRQFLTAPGCLSLLAASQEGAIPRGVLIARIAADEAELLTLGVAPAHRRQGVARALLLAAMAELRRGGARRLFLEIEDGNGAALGLYQSLGAAAVGRRPCYYAHGADAAIFSLAL